MAPPRYCVVFGIKDAADRFFPLGEFYLRGITIEQAKELFKRLSGESETGNYVLRLYERYYDKQTTIDVNYKKSEFTRETNAAGFHRLLDELTKLQEDALENKD